MKAFYRALAGIALLALTPACATLGTATSAPLSNTDADERGIARAFAIGEEMALLAAKLRKQGNACCQPGTPGGRQVSEGLSRAADFLEAASAAQQVGNGGLANLNLAEASKLLATVGRILNPAATTGGQQ